MGMHQYLTFWHFLHFFTYLFLLGKKTRQDRYTYFDFHQLAKANISSAKKKKRKKNRGRRRYLNWELGISFVLLGKGCKSSTGNLAMGCLDTEVKLLLAATTVFSFQQYKITLHGDSVPL